MVASQDFPKIRLATVPCAPRIGAGPPLDIEAAYALPLQKGITLRVIFTHSQRHVSLRMMEVSKG
jgi:hypothetical protein